MENIRVGSGTMIQPKYKAAGALALSIVGFLFTYPYTTSFAGGLLNNGCLAAVIGGLADWFAVTAIFRKPLGISYRTAVLPRNRQRIINEIIEFTGRDLLNTENIMKIVYQYDMAKMFIMYLEEHDGKEKVKRVTNQLVYAIFTELDTVEIGQTIENVVKSALKEFHLAPVLIAIMQESLHNKYGNEVMDFFFDECDLLLLDEKTHKLLVSSMAAMKDNYEQNSTGRKMVSFVLDLSPERLAQIVETELGEYVKNLKNKQHPLRLKLRKWLSQQICDLGENVEYQAKISKLEKQIMQDNFQVARKITDYIDGKIKQEQAEISSVWGNSIDHLIDEQINQFKVNQRLQKLVDQKIKLNLNLFIREQHSVITQLIQDRLNELSDAALVELVETKIADDLQMIRINGSLVGAVVGMVLYTVVFLAERMWG